MEEKLKIVRDILGGYRRSSNEFLYQCPYCGHHKKKMSINIAKRDDLSLNLLIMVTPSREQMTKPTLL